tara:strand:+ start:13 stop:2748 length:2736 start_codon:yes stop_codon:yes gene_type:complete
MARLKYRSSSKRKGFNPLQLSTQGITELRRDSERRIQGMRQNFEAEREQQRRDREAMKENAALEQDAINRDRKIEVENLKNEQIAMSQQESVDRQQAQYDAAAGKAIFDSLASLSKTVAVTAAKRTAKMKKDQTEEGENRDITELYDKTIKALDSLYVGSTAASADILENANETNEPLLKTIQAIVSEPGLGAIQERIVTNRIVDRLHGREISKSLQSTDRIYRDVQGNAFSAAESANDPDKMTIVTDTIRNDLIKRLGLDTAAPGYLDVSNKSIQERNKALIDRSYNGAVSQQEEIAKAKADDLRSSGLAADIAKAWELDSNVFNKAHAWKNTHAILEDPTSSISEASKAYAILDGVDMKAYHKNPEKYSILNADHKRAAQIQPRLAKRLENKRAADKATRDFAKADAYQYVFENADAINAGFRENANDQRIQLENIFHKINEPLPAGVRSMERAALAEDVTEERIDLDKHITNGTLTSSYINNRVQNRENKAHGIAALVEVEKRQYGAAFEVVEKAYEEEAQEMSGIDRASNAKNSFRVTGLTAQMVRAHKRYYKEYGDFNKAKEQVFKDIDDAKTPGKLTNRNRWAYAEPMGAGRTRYEWEKPEKDFSSNYAIIDDLMVTHGSNVAAFPFSIESSEETELTLTSSRIGQPIFSNGLIRVHTEMNKPENIPDGETPLTLPELFNETQLAKTKLDGVPRKLLPDNFNTKMQGALGPANLKTQQLALEHFSHDVARRNTANVTNGMGGINTLSGNTRASMPGGDPMQPLRNFAPQVSSVTFDEGQPGIDIFFEDHNFPAVLPGVVKDIGYQVNNDGSGYGNYLVIESIDSETGEAVDVLYSHLETKPSQSIGQNINLGQIIGKQGGTGSVQSYDGTIASIDFLAPSSRGSKSMTPYKNYDSLRKRIASQFQ